MRILYVLLSLIFFTTTTFAQEYLQLMQRENVNFYEVQRSAEKYFANRDKGRGSGFKQYKRWEYVAQKEIDDQGYIIKPKQVWNEQDLFLRNYYNSQAHQKKGPNKSLTGNWTSLGPLDWQRTSGWNPGVGRIVCIDVDDNNQNLIYVGSPTGGLWKTTDGGTNWQVLTDSFPVMDIWSVEIDPTNSNIVYMGTAGGGILKTTDGGNTWNQTGSISGTIRDILIHPSNNNIVFAARSGGVYRSTNGGTSWTQVSSTTAEDLRFKPGDPSIVYACGSNFQRSTNGGLSWSTITSGITNSERMKMDVSPANPNYVYIVQKSGNRFGRVYRSTNSGVSFTIRDQYNGVDNNYLGYASDGTDGGGQAGRDMAITVSNTDANEIIIAGIILFRSTDGGVNYTPLTEWFLPNSLGYVHADVEVLDYVGNTLFVGSDGGIYNSNDNGSNFTDLTAGIGIRQFYRIGCSQLDPNVVSGGSQDNGTSVMRGATQTWVDWLGADGMETFVDHSNANILYGTSQRGSMYKSTNQGNSRFSIPKPSGVGNGEWVTPFEIDPATATTIYVGFDKLYKNTSGSGPASNWADISPNLGSGNMDEICLAPSNANRIYVSYSSELYTTSDGGANWSSITEPWSGFINYISVDPNDPQRVAVAVSGSNKIYISNDGGSNWSNMTLNLPNIGANCVLLDATAENGIYVGMQSGVYYKDDLLGNWIPFLTDLPKVRVFELEIVGTAGKIRAGTYGRGLWESDVYSGNSGNLAPVANFSANTTNALVSTPIGFLDNSLGSPTSWNWSFPGGTPSSSTTQNPIVTYAAAGTYDVSLSVSNANGNDATTKTSFITITSYCIPDPATGTSDGDYIDGVALGTINNQNTGSTTGPSYHDYTDLSTDLERNSSQVINITSGSYFTDHFAVWIDYNQDNDFDDPGEKLGEVESTSPFQNLTIPFTVPSSAQLDSTTMRVRCVYNGANMNPCTNYTWGETEDYKVVIKTSCSISASFNTNTEFCEGDQSVNLSGGSPAGGTYFGTGVSGSDFDPQLAGVGTHIISYVYQESNGCADTASLSFNVNANPNVTHTPIADVCEDALAFSLNGASPSGGTYSGTGVSGTTFNPQVSGLGSFNIIYSYTDNNGCSDSTQFSIDVNPLPVVNLSGIPNLCESDNPITLTGGTPLGGIYSGPGVSNGMLDPSVAGSGTSLITYTYTDPSGCENVATQSINITPKPTVSFNTGTEFCEGDAQISLSGGSPSGGFYIGNGVSGANFSPIAAGVGSHIIEYAYQDVNGCSDTASLTFNVNPKPSMSHGNIPDACSDATAFSLSGGIPVGGTYSGNGVNANTFDPQLAGVGLHPIYYAFTNSNGCTDSILVNIQVIAPPTVILQNLPDICENATPINLSGGNPSGGIYSGAGVVSGQFDPSLTGTGTFTITYNYTDVNGCSNSDSKSINVIASPQASLTLTPSICENEGTINLTGGSPSGGSYSGAGVIGSTFDPSISGPGAQTISYIVSNANSCTDTAIASIQVNAAPVVSHTPVQDMCINDAPMTLNGGSPSGGTYFGTGMNGNQFNPQSAGLGSHSISYAFSNANGCSDTVVFGINVVDNPIVSINSIPDLCESSPVQPLVGSPSGGTFSGTGVNGTGFFTSSSGPGTFVITYTFTNSAGCTGVATDTVTVYSSPNVTLDTLNSVCENDQSFTLSGGLPAGGLYSGNGVTNGNFDPAVAGVGTHQITYMYTDANLCVAQAFEDIEVKLSPQADFGYTISALSSDFTDSSVNAQSWAWDFGDGNTSTSQNPTHAYASSGNYNVCLTVDNNSCSDQYCEMLSIITNLRTSINNDQFRFFPNPFESALNYSIQIEKEGNYRIDLMDIRSVNLKSFELSLQAGENEGRLDLNGLPAGTYILTISNNDSRKTVKIEKLK